MQKELSTVLRKVRSWAKEHKVADVILFGSYMRGKPDPKDIDLCIIIGKEYEKKSLDLVESLGKMLDREKFNFHINILTSESMFSGNTLAKTLINEGYSIKSDSALSSVLGFENKSMFEYSLSHFSPSERVKFHYLLKGRRGSEGILKQFKGKFIGTGTIIVPFSDEDKLKEIFDAWKVKYKIHKTLFG